MVKLPAFDPFIVLPQLLRKHVCSIKASSSLLWFLPVPMSLAIIAALLDGSLGGWSDIQAGLRDTIRAFTSVESSSARTAFPLLRDWPSMILLVVVGATPWIVHLQWCRIRDVVPALARVIVPRSVSERQLLGLRMRSPVSGLQAFRWAVYRLTKFLRNRWIVVAPVFVLAVTLTISFLTTARNSGVFSGLRPSGFAPGRWPADAYEQWWVGGENVFGFGLYLTLGTLFLFLVILQNVVGLLAVCLVHSMTRSFIGRADWVSRDGHFGWAPGYRVFQTVYISLGLNGLALTALVLIIGADHFRPVHVLFVVYVAAMIGYIAVPYIWLRRIKREACEQRAAEVRDAVASHHWQSSVESDLWEEARYAEMRSARIHPMRIPFRFLPAFSVSVLLPVISAVVPILFS